MGVALIRRRDDPKPDDLRARLGFQLATSGARRRWRACRRPSAWSAWSTGVMALSLPVRGCARAVDDRASSQPALRPIVLAELEESVMVLRRGRFRSSSLRFGVWGSRPGGRPQRRATVLLIRLSPGGWIGLRFDFSRLRALLGLADASRRGAWWRSSATRASTWGSPRWRGSPRSGCGRWRRV